MDQIEWNYKITKSNGQKKEKDVGIVPRGTEFKLSLSAKGSNEQLTTLMEKIAPLIAKLGGQDTLPIDFE